MFTSVSFHSLFYQTLRNTLLQIDLSSWLPEPTFEEEAKLWEEMIQHGVLFTPGGIKHCLLRATFPAHHAPLRMEKMRFGASL